ncbi:MAG: electron transfer flavoprotein subunit alpha/FixB family protein [Veillonellaceae bacterium]|nr:electron transfer flavoprotein subunit alpha/FixB family protein [Veillonellaceae bacterium]
MSRHIYVIAEHFDGKLRPVTKELVGKAQELAATVGQEAHAILLGHEAEGLAEELIACGADVVHYADAPELAEYTTEGYTYVIAEFLREREPNAVLIGATSNGRDLAPRLSARLRCGVTADCTGMAAEAETGLITWTRPALGGNILADIVCPTTRPQMGTVRPNVFPKPTADPTRQGRVERLTVAIPAGTIRTERLAFERVEGDEVNLEDAEIIVSGGRGMGTAEQYNRLHRLAQLLGGSVAASRAAVEAGWAPSIHQVGQTGKNVGPKIYFAFGISGAIQHLAGIGGSDTVIAINKDAAAPIFEVADYGIVGDVHEVLEAMIAKLEAGERLC